ncbi:MAG TPA: response regulator [Longimicrobiales bacterium]|nr:response regulator [Longimicrobiales bacterium]
MSNGKKILVVDDDRDLVDILTMVLTGKAYQVVQAYGPQEALAAVDREHPDLILLDVMMPEATEGFHVVWNLRGRDDPYSATVPIIMLTAIHRETPLRFYPDARDHTYGAGEYLDVQGFVDKPVEPDALLAEVDRVLAAARGP